MPDMLVKLYTLPTLAAPMQALEDRGIVVRSAMAYEKHLVAAWVQGHFGRGWGSECKVAFSRQPVSCFVAVDDGRMVGFGCYECTCKNFFGPMGVAEQVRGRGVGKVLLLACLHAMAAQGYAYAIIGDAGEPAFYERTLGAMAIMDSSPGIYRNRLQDPQPKTP